MSARHMFSSSVAAGALLAAFPASAQPEMTYEYAHPLPGDETVVYRQDPVVQPVPAPPAPAPQAPYRPAEPAAHYAEPVPAEGYPYEEEDRYETRHEYETRYEDNRTVHPARRAAPPAPYHRVAAPHPAPAFDREAWLDECRARYRAERKRGDGGVIGGLLGAATGGLIGNRVADGERLAGTLIGAGVGGLAGLAIGSAIGEVAGRDRAKDYCEGWLDQHRQAYAPPAAPAYGHPAPYGYAQPAGYYGAACACAPAVTYMPVLVAVPQRAVVREYVTEEWVEVEAKPQPRKRRTIRRAPPADKRIKYVKGQ
ncbi:MAG: hypothetical protein VX569_13530 [Pseudomonadota bacterium]|nr:hypothetical protein [Pseudomonadota bacterium]